MKFIQALYVITAFALSGVIVGVSCLQYAGTTIAIETPFEEPIDENAKDISDDFADDKEYTSHAYAHTLNELEVLHSDGYLVSHANLVKEISTPPPKF